MLGLVFAGLCTTPGLSQTSSKDAWVGVWQTVPKVDAVAAFKGVVHPFHKKLVTYAIQQVEKANVVLDLRANHSCAYVFKDGYPGDMLRVAGTWQMQGDHLQIDFDPPIGVTGPKVTHILTPSGTTLAWDYIPGVPKFFSGTLVPSKFTGVRDPGASNLHGAGTIPFAS